MFKLDIATKEGKEGKEGKKGKTYHLETGSEVFIDKKIGDKVKGDAIKEFKDLADYEFVITGASDKQGFPALSSVEGPGRKRVLLTRGKGLKRVRKKKKLKKPVKGLRLRKTVHGNVIAADIAQINLKVSKQGAKPLNEIFKKEAKEEKETKKESEIEKEKPEKPGEKEVKIKEEKESKEEQKA